MDDWRKMGLKTAKTPAVMRKKVTNRCAEQKNAPRSWGGRGIIALTAPNRCPLGGCGVAAGGIAPEVNLIVMRADVGIGPYIVHICKWIKNAGGCYPPLRYCGVPKKFIVGAAICRPRCFVMKNIRYLAYPTRALCSRVASAGESVDCLSVLYRVSSNRLSPAGRA